MRGDTIEGWAHALDGSTLVVWSRTTPDESLPPGPIRVRLFGIVTFEMRTPQGWAARGALDDII